MRWLSAAAASFGLVSESSVEAVSQPCLLSLAVRHDLRFKEAGDAASALEHLAHCSNAVRLWFVRNSLRLNADKSRSG